MAIEGDLTRESRIRELLPLVKKIARRVRRLVPSVDLDDLVGDGSIGLIRAVDSFDPARGPSLEQYARSVVAGAMLNGIRRMDHVSERARRAVRYGEEKRYGIAVLRGSVPSVAETDGLVPGFGRALLAAYRSQPLSLDTPLPDGERLGGDWREDPACIVERRLRDDALRNALLHLPERQRKLICDHYFSEHSLREIGRRMSISAQRASQLRIAAVTRMRKVLDAAPH